MRALGHIWPLSWPTSIWKGRRHQNTAGIPDLLLWLARPPALLAVLFSTGLEEGKVKGPARAIIQAGRKKKRVKV